MKAILGIVAITLGAVALPASAQIDFTDDFEAGLTGWNGFVNVFQNDCSAYVSGYAYTVPGANVAKLEDDAGNQVLNVFADYGNAALGDVPPKCLVSNVFVERTLTAGDAGEYTFAFDYSAGAAPGANTRAFIKLLDPAASYATTYQDYASTAGTGSGSLEITLDASQAGLILQWGFDNTAVGYVDSGRWYDNVSFAATATGGGSSAPRNPASIPVLPLWALFGLAGLIGLMGLRRKS